MEHFTPISALAGGALIGLAASMMLLFNGRIAGISGIYGGLLRPVAGDIGWRVAFVLGLLVGGGLLVLVAPELVAGSAHRSLVATAIAGVIVGFGTRMGNGCTSGHGVCGLTRFSRRSLVATLTFMTTGFLTASLITLLAGGSL
ncbi:MAG: YeeE/YedE family protein [Deltaproteobacteria bacterium]|nr:MAG: YeeE/YedE family protein [Deltaproteobacteria bacterium]